MIHPDLAEWREQIGSEYRVEFAGKELDGVLRDVTFKQPTAHHSGSVFLHIARRGGATLRVRPDDVLDSDT